jgi:hypothetical protein
MPSSIRISTTVEITGVPEPNRPIALIRPYELGMRLICSVRSVAV